MDDWGGAGGDGSHCIFSGLEVALKLRYSTLLQKQFTPALSFFLSFFVGVDFGRAFMPLFVGQEHDKKWNAGSIRNGFRGSQWERHNSPARQRGGRGESRRVDFSKRKGGKRTDTRRYFIRYIYYFRIYNVYLPVACAF